MPRNPIAPKLRAQQVIPNKRKTYREHLDETLEEEIPDDLKRLLDDIR